MLSVSELRKSYEIRRTPFSVRKETIRAVDRISFDLEQGQTLGLVGESGCGKSTVAKCITMLEKPDEGRILFMGRDWVNMAERQRKGLRKEMQIIFQDPFSSLNPRKRVLDTIAEPLKVHRMVEKGSLTEKVLEVLKSVGLDEDFLKKYPHEMSGGQRQRVAIGRALATAPSFIVADEPVSSLDVSVQAQIINLFLDIRERFRISMLFISHDLNIVRFISDRTMVMYRGKVVETGETEELFSHPLHPYTRLLMQASNDQERETEGQGAKSNDGCVFLDGCSERKEMCADDSPMLKGPSSHSVACFLYPE
ncbi:MAG TPA: oligopeptide/dipeptide ABC transporter ATP-binding protein [Syntrophorhabdales bacterium]|nr:oligopeptide/dipeptide ABC transporter ATP-binding protein [Syntrophorhabdales bacterium]